MFLFPLDMYPVVEFLDHIVVACLTFDDKLILQSGCTISHFHQQCMRATVSPHPFLSILIILVHAEWYLIVVLICMSLVINVEKAMATHSSTPAGKIPWMEEPGVLQSIESLGVGQD